MNSTGYWVNGRRVTSEELLVVSNPTGATVGYACIPSLADVEAAVAGMHDFFDAGDQLSLGVRADALRHVATRLDEREEEFAQLIHAENGKPIKWAHLEVQRASSVFRWAAEETRRWNGDLQRLDTEATAKSGEGRLALVRRMPTGPVLAITPFNFPLNLVAHKVAPALAVGAPVLVKPAPSTPLSALLLGELIAETVLPGAMWAVLPIPNESMPALVRDERLPIISFTGSGAVGYQIGAAAPHKQVVLELGGNAAAVVMSDFCSSDDLDFAADRIATFANYQAGQSCIAVQRVLVDWTQYDDMVARIVAVVTELTAAEFDGIDREDGQSAVGPLVDETAAERVISWIDEAAAAGAKVLAGGTRNGPWVAPTVLVDVPRDAKVWSEEVFGPVMCIAPFDGASDAIDIVNDSSFGLQVGVFTRDIQTAFLMHARLRVGGVIIGDVPSYRADQMPYGGVKQSGVGREGVRYAMDDLTHERVLVLSGITF